MRAETAWRAGWARSRASRGAARDDDELRLLRRGPGAEDGRRDEAGAALRDALGHGAGGAGPGGGHVDEHVARLEPGEDAVGTSRIASSARSSETQVMTRSRPSAHSRGDFAARAPLAAKGLQRSAGRFQTVMPRPVLRMLLAIAKPMVPRPRKPIWIGIRNT